MQQDQPNCDDANSVVEVIHNIAAERALEGGNTGCEHELKTNDAHGAERHSHREIPEKWSVFWARSDQHDEHGGNNDESIDKDPSQPFVALGEFLAHETILPHSRQELAANGHLQTSHVSFIASDAREQSERLPD